MSQTIPLPLIPLCVALSLGRASPSVYALSGACLALLLAWHAERIVRGRYLAALLVAFCAGALVPKTRASLVPSFPAHIVARVLDAPVAGTDERQSVSLRVQAVRGSPREGWSEFCVEARASLSPRPPVSVGDVIEAAGRFRAVEARANPTDRFGRSPRFVVEGAHVHRSFAHPLQLKVSAMRRQVYADLGALAEPGRSVARALFLGARGDMPDDLRRRWAAAGLAHLLAISGLHVTLVGGAAYGLVAAIAWSLARLGRTPRGWRQLASTSAFFVAVLYCLWVGAPTSAVRAVLMAAAMAVAALSGERMASIRALVLAFTAIVMHDDRAFGDLGLWLSVLAVSALLAPNATRWQRWLEALVAPAMATAPIVAGAFGSVAWASPLANALALPIATFVLTPLVLCHGVGLFAGASFLSSPVEWATALVDVIATHCARAEATSVGWSTTEVIFSSAAATGSAWLRAGPRWLLRSVVIASLAFNGAGSSRLLRVTHIAVGQGDATLIQLPQGDAWLIDGGGRVGRGRFDPGRAQVVPALLGAGVRSLDTVVATHGDADHVRGLHAVLERFPVRRLLWNGSTRPVMQRLVLDAHRRGVRVIRVDTRHQVRLGAVQLIVEPASRADSENDASLVTLLRYGRFSAAFPGDISSAREADIRWPDVSVLLAPHHGSKTSSSEALLRAARPDWVVVSAGRDNLYRMPHPSVLERYRSVNALVWRLDERGQLRVESDGEQFWGFGRCGGLRGCDPRRGSLRP